MLFGICLSLFLEQTRGGRVIALDEAHNYMGDSQDNSAFTEELLKVIRLQRHLGARVIISTQEPTVSPKLLDLCSVTVVHRFTSPDWIKTLKQHLAGATATRDGTTARGDKHDGSRHELVWKKMGGISVVSARSGDPERALFALIVGLQVGEALVFSPSAVIDVAQVRREDGTVDTEVVRLGNGVLRLQIRKRITTDGGRSKMAS
jgi:hypothetical protein